MSLAKLAKDFWAADEDIRRADRDLANAQDRKRIATLRCSNTIDQLMALAKIQGPQYVNLGTGKLMVVTDSGVTIKDLTMVEK